MALLSILLILTGTTGIHSITTVSKVSVKVGSSISIPCLYDAQYVNHVKYLCEGYGWSGCSTAVKTNQALAPKKFSIIDDKKERIFTVTIRNLTSENTYFWCIVEINRGRDVGQFFELSVTSGTPSLTVARQEITGYERENITINCQTTRSGKMKWCRVGGKCVTEPSGLIDETKVTIRSDSFGSVVTMSGLRLESSGWYWCVKDVYQIPVHLTVMEKPTTTSDTVTEDRRITIDEPKSVSFDLKNPIIPLSLLILAVIVALSVWFILRCKNAKAESVDTNKQSTHEDTDVTYSSVTISTKKREKMSNATADDVTYSNLTFQHQ
ncbi:polymeric immunoglobulin receptor-like isoform 1-T1 [Menidia menidia]